MIDEDCLNRFLGKCPDCEKDYDTSHNPNNYDCLDYTKIHVEKIKTKIENE